MSDYYLFRNRGRWYVMLRGVGQVAGPYEVMREARFAVEQILIEDDRHTVEDVPTGDRL